MSAQPGWYDAGTPGQERWWDGVQWTAHERPAVVAVQPPIEVRGAPMGWYPVPGTTDVRWWDGAGWTPYRIREGAPRADVSANEPGGVGLALGIVFFVLGAMQVSSYSFSGESVFALTPVLFFVAGALWLIGGIRVSRLQKLPPPVTAPVFDAVTRPLPGEEEGAGAGWFPVHGQICRWWTGVRWSPYIAQRIGVRPTQSGPRSYRISLILGVTMAGLGALGAVLGFALIGALGQMIGWAIALPAIVFVFVGGLVVLMTCIRRYTMILPPQAPPLR